MPTPAGRADNPDRGRRSCRSRSPLAAKARDRLAPLRRTAMAATESTTTRGSGRPQGADQRPADVLVVFGITGDLARVMTFRSLYRLESRGLLDCPVVGVAVDD